MKFRFKSIKTKVVFWFATATILLLVVFNVAIYHFIEQNTKLSIQNKLYNKAVFINKNIMANIPIKELIKDEQLKNVDIALINEDKIIFQKGKTNFKQFQKLIKRKDSFFVFTQEDKLNGLYILKIYTPFKGAILFYEHNIDAQIDDNIKVIRDILFFLEPLLLFALIFMVSKVSDKILKSINKITTTANEIYVDDFSKEIPKPKYNDEIQDLVDAFNKMIYRLKDGVQILEQFNSDVSHELKTPLTVIKGEIEITLNKIREPEYYIESLKTIEKEAMQIQTIVDNLLLLTKFTKENIKQTFEPLSLDTVLLNTIDKYNSIAKVKNIKINIKKFEAIEINANPILINTIFSNLIDNAIKYSPENRNIHISLYKRKKTYFIITDEGIGMKKEHLQKITDRFYRIDESRNKKVKGFGLGLSIVKNSIELHNGKIRIKSKENQGTSVKVVL